MSVDLGKVTKKVTQLARRASQTWEITRSVVRYARCTGCGPIPVQILNRHRLRGFTLVELMIVVVIAGVLATVAVYGVSRYIASAKTSEAVQMIGAIKTAQESYLDETFQYLSVADDVTTNASFYPHDFLSTLPGRDKVQWGAGTSDVANRWRELGVTPAGPVLFAYATTAGGPGTVASPGSDASIGSWPTTLGRPWYIVKAKADLDGGGASSVFVGVSFTTQIFITNEGE